MKLQHWLVAVSKPLGAISAILSISAVLSAAKNLVRSAGILRSPRLPQDDRDPNAWRAAMLAAALVFSVACESFAVGVDDYQYQRSFTLPAGPTSFSSVLFDALPDGRLLQLNDTTVSVETAPKSATYVTLGNIPGFSPIAGPSFLVISPDGTHAAAGSNGGGSVVVFETNNPAGVTSYPSGDFGAEWLSNNLLAISSGFGSAKVDILNTSTAALTSVVTNILGASGGVSIDAAGNLFVGNGFGADAGRIKAFAAADWQTALATNSPLNFATQGTPIADLLSAYPIGFDSSGNMFVGGADFFFGSGDIGYAALVDAAAVANALAVPQASPPITTASSAAVLRKFPSPQSTIDNQLPPNWNFNAATGELYLNYIYGGQEVSVYSAVPEPASALLLVGATFLTVLRVRKRAACHPEGA